MSSRPTGLLQAALRRLSPAPPDDSDAELLGRYVRSRDGDAFAALVRRHGPMVLGVCRRRLGNGPDSEDAYQVTFMVLARDAARVVSRESVGGWLYRVAYLVALKQSGRLGHRPDPLPDEPPSNCPTPDADAAGREHLAILDEELSALPDKLRSVVVLCALEERSNSEAASLLGCPTGTIDSRLSAARAKLRARLARRGLAGLAAALPGVAADAADPDAVARAAIAYAVHGGSTDPLSSLADGVLPTMTTLKFKLLVAGLSLAVFGTAGLGLFHAAGQDAPKPTTAEQKKTDPQKPTEPPKKAAPEAEAEAPLVADEVALRLVLRMPAQIQPDGVSLKEFFDELYKKHGVIARLDMAAYLRVNPPSDFNPYEMKIKLPVTRGMSVADMLTEVLAQFYVGVVEGTEYIPFTYRVRGGQVAVVPAYVPPTIPGNGANIQPGELPPLVSQKRILEQIVGEPVTVALDDVPFAEAVKELRKLTGANIVVDSRCKENMKERVSGAFGDVRLLTVLTVLADMCELKPVAMNNVYYVTTPENSDRLQKQANADLFGVPPAQVPAGYVTDGLHLYEKPGNLKPVDPFAGGGGGVGVHGVVPAPPKPAEKKPTEKKQ